MAARRSSRLLHSVASVAALTGRMIIGFATSSREEKPYDLGI